MNLLIECSILLAWFKIIVFFFRRFREGDRESIERILVGTIDGRIGLLVLEGNKTIRITWLVNTTGPEITCLDTYELDDGIDILVGRQDGTVDVYAFPDEEDTTPTLRFRYVSFLILFRKSF